MLKLTLLLCFFALVCFGDSSMLLGRTWVAILFIQWPKYKQSKLLFLSQKQAKHHTQPTSGITLKSFAATSLETTTGSGNLTTGTTGTYITTGISDNSEAYNESQYLHGPSKDGAWAVSREYIRLEIFHNNTGPCGKHSKSYYAPSNGKCGCFSHSFSDDCPDDTTCFTKKTSDGQTYVQCSVSSKCGLGPDKEVRGVAGPLGECIDGKYRLTKVTKVNGGRLAFVVIIACIGAGIILGVVVRCIRKKRAKKGDNYGEIHLNPHKDELKIFHLIRSPLALAVQQHSTKLS